MHFLNLEIIARTPINLTLFIQRESNGTVVDLTDPIITRAVDGTSPKFVDADYTNVLDCVFMRLEIEDPESAVDHLNITVRRKEGKDIITERRYDWCNDKTGCIPGKVRMLDACIYCAHFVHSFAFRQHMSTTSAVHTLKKK